MADDNKNLNIQGSGIEEEAAKKALADSAAAKIKATADAATVAKKEADAKKMAADVSKGKEFQDLKSEYEKKIADLTKDKTDAESSLTSFKDRIDALETTKKEADEKNLTDLQKMQKRQTETDEKILDLLKKDQDRETELGKYKKENSRKEILQTSGLDPKYWEYINASEPEEIKQKVEKFVEILGEAKKAALSDVPAANQNQQIGSGVVGTPPNEGTQATSGKNQDGQPTPSQEEINNLKNSANLYDLELFLLKYPHLQDQILP